MQVGEVGRGDLRGSTTSRHGSRESWAACEFPGAASDIPIFHKFGEPPSRRSPIMARRTGRPSSSKSKNSSSIENASIAAPIREALVLTSELVSRSKNDVNENGDEYRALQPDQERVE